MAKSKKKPAFSWPPPPPPELDGIRLISDIELAQTPEKRLPMNIYLPEKMPKDPLPVILMVHGGGWKGGDQNLCGAIRHPHMGYAVASITYRFSQDAIYPAQIHDCKAAVRFLRAHAEEYHIDPSRIGAFGGSAGGHLVSLLGCTAGVEELEGAVGGNLEFSSEVQAVVSAAGPTDFLQFFKLGGRKKWQSFGLLDDLVGGPLGRRRDLAKLANPINFIDGSEPPFFLGHGKMDNVVPYEQSVILKEALDKVGVEAVLMIDPLGTHFSSSIDMTADLDGFLAKHLKPGKRERP